METLKELQFAFDTSQISRSTYFRKMKKIREGKSLKRRKGSGRPRKIKGKFIQKAASIAPKYPHISAKKIANRLQTEDNISVHKSTVQRTLKRSGIARFGERFLTVDFI